jgi:hypothetical protein
MRHTACPGHTPWKQFPCHRPWRQGSGRAQAIVMARDVPFSQPRQEPITYTQVASSAGRGGAT